MAATPNGSRLTRQASMPLSSFTGGQQVYSFNRPPQPVGGAPGSTGPGQIGNRSSIARSATSAKETILTWVQQQVNHYNNVNVTNFSTCWNDGLAFCALIHNFYPEAFDFDKLESRNRRYNFKLAFDVSEKYGDVCPLLDVDDMVKMTKPDWKCVFTYVQSFYRRFRNGREKISPKRTLALQRSPDREDPANVSALEMSIPWRGPTYSKTEFVLNPKATVQPFEKFKNFKVPSLPKTDFKTSAKAINATGHTVGGQPPKLNLSPNQSTNNFYQFSNTTPCNQLTRQQRSLLLQRQSSLPQSSGKHLPPSNVKQVRLQTSENQAQFQSHLSRNLSLISFISQKSTNQSPPCSPLPALTSSPPTPTPTSSSPLHPQHHHHPTPIHQTSKAQGSIGHAPFQRQASYQGIGPDIRSNHFDGSMGFSRQRSTSPSCSAFPSPGPRSNSRQMSLPPMPKLAPPPPPPLL